ncbi:hypothetical protein MKW92_034033 [Papaver armeniacum]|nr:hypothetical protein MKW92_034033 [Papaver armeniacum]
MAAKTRPFNLRVSLHLYSRYDNLGVISKVSKGYLTEMGFDFTIMTADIDDKAIRMKSQKIWLWLWETESHLANPLFQYIYIYIYSSEDLANGIISRIQTTDCSEKNAEPALLITADTVYLNIFFPPSTSDSTIKNAVFLRLQNDVRIYEGVIREKPSSKEEAPIRYSGGRAATVGSVLVTNLTAATRRGEWDRVEIPDEVIEKLAIAGGLIIEHPLTLPFIEEVVGTTDSVMGLPRLSQENSYMRSLRCLAVILPYKLELD